MLEKKTLAETMAQKIEEDVLAGVYGPGSTLPTEPALATEFGVSRAVVRDAARILLAKGLIDVRQGKGMFVTENQTAGFGDALLLALRRRGATVWDVEQYELIVYPEIAAMAASRVDEVDFVGLRERLRVYRDAIAKLMKENPSESWFRDEALDAWRELNIALYEAGGNALFAIVGPAAARLRNVRNWESEEEADPDFVADREAGGIEQMFRAIESGNPDAARRTVQELLALPPAAVEAMKQTPVGEVPKIPVRLEEHLQKTGYGKIGVS